MPTSLLFLCETSFAATGVKMAHGWMMLAMAVMMAGPALTAPSSLNIKKDALYFPDQVEYIRAAYGKCLEEDMLFWPGNGLCYAEGTQGPCPFEFRLVWDDRQTRPRCEPDNSLLTRRR